MKAISLIFPNQLFKHHPALERDRPVFLVEEFLFFRVQAFHKQRLVLLRAAMQTYASFLKKKGYKVYYIEAAQLKKRGDLFNLLHQKGVLQIHLADFADQWLKEDLKKATKRFKWTIQFYPSPMFLCTEEEIRSFFSENKHYSMAKFYAAQRKNLNILMKEGHPIGGKFSFDAENRKRLLRGTKIPKYPVPKQNIAVKRAIAYVEKEFPNTVGEASPFLYPVTFKQAENSLSNFIKNRLKYFGDYEDAIGQDESFLFHSVLSPLLNIGLLTPQQVLNAVLITRAPINSLEGFIRQIIGWREFIRACYVLKGNRQRTSNYFQHHSPIPKGFWNATTGIVPVDRTIERILKTGYCHHIERLMILGNFLLLTETDPNAVYEWFMAYFVDAYDWVMVPNVYGMSQFADRGQMTTKPYISGANYILKMSDYSRGDWADIWDGLFWRFLSKHKSLFQVNPRTKPLLSLLSKNKGSILPKVDLAEKWLKLLLG
jgi:deoxyribodipyrimidine photolyase-related protein